MNWEGPDTNLPGLSGWMLDVKPPEETARPELLLELSSLVAKPEGNFIGGGRRAEAAFPKSSLERSFRRWA